MRKILSQNRGIIFKLLWLIPGLLIFVGQSAVARTTIITSLPYTASQAGTAYSETLVVAGTRLSGTGSGINFTGHDIVLNLVSDTITFGTSGADNVFGLNFSNAHHIRIEGGWIIHGVTNDTLSYGAICAKFTTAPHDILFHNVKMKVTGDDAHCMDSYGAGVGIYNIEVSGGQFWNYCRRYANRCNYDGAVLRFEAPTAYGNFNVKIHDIRIWTGPGQGIVGLGRLGALSRIIVYGCTLSVDHINERYPYDDGNVCHNSANPYLIHLRFVGAGTSIHDNVLRSGTAHGGSRGLMLENAVGSSSNYVEVYNNDCNTHEGPNVHYGEDFQNFGLRIRPIDGGEIAYLNVHDNKFIVSGDTLDSTHDFGSQPIGGCYSNDITSNRFVRIERNLFRAFSDSLVGVNSKAFLFDGVNGDTTFVFRYNRMESDMTVVKFGDYNFGAKDVILSQDTLRWITPVQEGFCVYHVGHLGNNWDCSDNMVKDMVYEGSAADTNIEFATAGILEITLMKTMTVLAMGRNDLPVRGATVTAINHYNRTVLTGTTDNNGVVSGPVSYWFESRNEGDSMLFNNFTVRVRKNQDSTTISTPISSSSPPVSVRLFNTDGEQPGGGDIIPPAAIHDLGAIPGDRHGRINLTWIAPGDDDTIGTASYYVIKYSQNIITEQNWEAAVTASNPPLPELPGTPQEFVLDSLNQGEIYFVAIKTVDDGNNFSGLSNVPESFATGVMQPQPLNTVVEPSSGVAYLYSSTVQSYLTLYYEFELDDTPDFATPRLRVATVVDTVASVSFDSLQQGITYHWRCRAMASNYSDSSLWSATITFNVETGVTLILSSADCIFPAEGEMIQTRRPVFKVRGVSDVTDIYIQVADNPAFQRPYQSGALATQSGSETDWQINTQLRGTGNYYWRISSDNILWTTPVSFAANIDIHPYPNPFRSSEGHSSITFTNLPANCRINIATVSGSVVKEAKGVGPDDWIWDVKSDSGRDLASGVYLYMVEFENGSTSGKVMIIR